MKHAKTTACSIPQANKANNALKEASSADDVGALVEGALEGDALGDTLGATLGNALGCRAGLQSILPQSVTDW